MSNNFDILIVDDHNLFRKGFISIIKDIPDIGEIKEASGNEELFEILNHWTPNLLILDLEMPKMDGVEISEKILANYPNIKILIITMHDNDELIGSLFSIGINGFLVKNADPEEIILAIDTLMAHDLYYNRRIVNIMQNLLFQKANDQLPVSPQKLSNREIDVLRLICWENTTSQIANKLDISIRTVEKVRSVLIQKTSSINTIGLIKYAFQHKLVVF